MKTKRYKPNDGWLSVRLPLDVDGKLREMAAKTRLSLTAIVCNGLEREYDHWKSIHDLIEGHKGVGRAAEDAAKPLDVLVKSVEKGQ